MRAPTFVPALVPALVLVTVLADASVSLGAQNPAPASVPPQSPTAQLEAPGASAFPGQWDYNAADSVIAGTTRPEQAPRAAGWRGAGVPMGGSGSATQGGGGGRGGGTGTGGGGRGSGVGMGAPGMGAGSGRMRVPAAFANEARDAARDLLEVPETLTIAVTPDEVTFTDDLGRALTFPTDGRKHKRQLGAARFDAQTRWSGNQLRKSIETAVGFKMTETYFLSADGQRLFVIIRVGEPKPDEPIVGVDRVYDRVPQGGK